MPTLEDRIRILEDRAEIADLAHESARVDDQGKQGQEVFDSAWNRVPRRSRP